tara:strand:+ start:597 stop:1373 length:777 start_codon:yes stop_codon:yes gene_type:complete
MKLTISLGKDSCFWDKNLTPVLLKVFLYILAKAQTYKSKLIYCPVSEIAKVLKLDSSNVSKYINTLISLGYITRKNMGNKYPNMGNKYPNQKQGSIYINSNIYIKENKYISKNYIEPKLKKENMPKRKFSIPTTEDILLQTVIPDELKYLNGFQEVWAEWVQYKQDECMDVSGNAKPWNTVQAGQRFLNQIKNEHNKGRDVCHVIRQSLLNQWVGIRFDLVPDPKQAPLGKSKDQVSALDQAWHSLTTNTKEVEYGTS